MNRKDAKDAKESEEGLNRRAAERAEEIICRHERTSRRTKDQRMFSPRHNHSAHLHPSVARRVTFFERPKKVTEEIRPAATTTSAVLAAIGEPSVARSGLLVSDGFGCGKAVALSELRLTVSIFFGREGTGCAETHNAEGTTLQSLWRAEHRRRVRDSGRLFFGVSPVRSSSG